MRIKGIDNVDPILQTGRIVFLIFIGAYVLTMWFVNMEEDREDYVISDQMKKTGTGVHVFYSIKASRQAAAN